MRKAALILAFILTAILCVTGIAAADSDYGTPGENELAPNITIRVNNVVLEEGGTYQYHKGDTVDVNITWEWPDEIFRDVDLPEVMFIDMGEDFQLSPGWPLEGIIYQNGDREGTYTIDENGRLTIYLDDSFRLAGQTKRSLVFTCTGTFPLDPEKDQEGEAKTVTIFEQTFEIEPEYDASGLNGSKSAGSVVFDRDTETYSVIFTAEVKATGKVTDVVLTDTFGDFLYCPDDGEITVYRDGQVDDSLEPEWIDDHRFTLKVGEMADQEVVRLEYKLHLTEDALKELAGSSGSVSSDELKNTLEATFKDSHGVDRDMDAKAATVSVTPPELKKSGEFVDEDDYPGLVEWTVTLTSGFLGDLNDARVLNALNTDLRKFLEQIGSGQKSAKQEWGQDWNDGFDSFIAGLTPGKEGGLEGTIDLDEYVVKVSGPDNSGSYTYTFTFYTLIDGTQATYTNDVSIEIMDDVTLKDSAAVGIGWDFDKVFIGQKGEEPNATMEWAIDVEVPEANIEGLDKIIITDSPMNDNTTGNFKDTYRHKVILNTIKIGGTPVSSLLNDGVTVEAVPYDDGSVGFKLTILSSSSFLQKYRAKTLEKERHMLITFETEAVDADGKREGSLEGAFHWENKATRDFVIDKESNTISRDDVYEKTMDSLFEKKANTGTSFYDDGQIFYWRVEFAGTALRYDEDTDAWTGLLTDPEGMTFHLTDTLPENSRFVPNSAFVRLDFSDYTGNRAIAPCTDELTKRLTVTEHGDGTVGFSWKSDDALLSYLKQELKANNAVNSSGGVQLWLCYETAVDDFTEASKDWDWSGGGYVTQVNTVSGEVNGMPGFPSAASQTLYYYSDMRKSTDYGDNTYRDNNGNKYVSTDSKVNVPFTIDVNPYMMSLGENGYVELKDTLGSSLELILESVEVYPYVPSTEVLGYVPSDTPLPAKDVYLNYDNGSNVLIIRLPDGMRYQVRYWATITDESTGRDPVTGAPLFDAVQDGSNTVEINLGASSMRGSSTEVKRIFVADVYATSDSFTFKLYKYMMGENGMDPLEGAEFDLVAGSFDAEGSFIPDPKNARTYKVTVDGATTSYIFSEREDLNYVFRLTETKAPEGYKLDEIPRYLYFTKYFNGDATTLPEGVEEYDIKKTMYFENKPAGGLSVTKQVQGTAGETDRDFGFTVKLSDTSVSGTYGGMTFQNGVATFTLRHGQTITAEGLPVGVGYTVLETTVDDYVTTATGETGNITKNVTAAAIFTNIRNAEPETPVGSLSVTKEVKGTAGETDRDFTFIVQLDDKSIAGAYGGMTFASGTATFTLRHGQTVTATGLPVGVNYSVSEQTADGYVITATGATGVIVKDATAAALFINTKDVLPVPEIAVGSLSVTKEVKGTAGETDRDFNFTVLLSDTSVSGKYGDMTFANGVAMFTLRHGQTVKATGLPAGVNYTVSERTAEGYATTSTGEKGVIAEDATSVAIFINTKDAPVVPETGDRNQPLLWTAMMLLALAGIGLGMRRRER